MTTVYRTLLFLLLVAGISVSFNSRKQNKATRPNVVIIFMDDMGYGDPECFGGLPYKTPNINKLAAEGMRFTHFYAAQAACTASRAALLTGSYPNRLSLPGVLGPQSTIALNPDEETIAEVLKKSGYKTGMVGKWHLGNKVPFLPQQQGFDDYLGLPYSHDMWPVGYDGKPLPPSCRRSKMPPLFLLSGSEKIKEIKTLDDQATLTGIYTRKACEFIRDNKNNPFFLYIAHSMPHVPIAASPEFKGKSNAGLFGDMMMELDWSVGKVMRTLDDLNLSQNTLVIFTSDNGPWLSFGDHAGNTGGLREGKGSSWEGGVRVPAIFRWKNIIQPGTICNEIASTIDILPTVAFFSGASLPAKKIDGVDISPLLLQKPNAEPRKHFVYYYSNNSLQAIRQGSWKLVFEHSYRSYKQDLPGRNGNPGPVTTVKTPVALYNLRTDPGETQDLQQSFPEIVKELNILADAYRKELGDDLTNNAGTARRPAGLVTDGAALQK